jgi:hypothetical protein
MRTKTLLLTAALCAAGAATSMAQVYSVNMVGYINQQIPQGFSMIANQLNNSPDNKITSLFPNPPGETQVFKFNGAGYNSLTYITDLGWDPTSPNIDMTLAPGEGVFIFAPSAFTQTFVGEVALNSTVNITQGFQVVSSALPQSLPLDAAPPAGLGFPIAPNDFVFLYKPAGGYDTFEAIDDGSGGIFWNPSAPAPAVGQSFFFSGSVTGPANRSWIRNFSVGP